MSLFLRAVKNHAIVGKLGRFYSGINPPRLINDPSTLVLEMSCRRVYVSLFRNTRATLTKIRFIKALV